LIIAPFTILKVEAILGGGIGLALNPSNGVTGTIVQVSLDIPSWLKNQGTYESPSQYYNTAFSLFWDIGGWGYIPVPAELQNLAKTKNPIGTAQVDSNGLLTGKITIPPSDVGDEHVIFAIPKNPDSMETLSHFWGFFHVTGTGTAQSPTSTPTPTPTQDTQPTQTTPSGNFTLTIISDEPVLVKIDDQRIVNVGYMNPIFLSYAEGTQVKLFAFNYSGTDTLKITGWEITSSNDKYSEQSDTVIVTINDNLNAKVLYDSTFIPGFPFESILIGLFTAIGLLYLTKKKLTLNPPMPT
jgi:hypothetical protein